MITKAKNPISSFFADPNRLERIWLLAKVDFKKRYYESKLGLVWAFLNPFFRVLIYYFAFTYFRSAGIERFALYLFSGLILWMFFTESTTKSLSMFKSKKYLIENIKFNIVDLFISLIISTFIGLIFNFCAYYIVSLLSGVPFYIGIVWIPLIVFNLVITTAGVSMIVSCLSLYFQDIKHLWSLIVLAGFWTAPIFFTEAEIMANAPWLIYIHPGSGTIINLRNAIFYGNPINWSLFMYNLCYGLIALIIGYWLLKKCATQISERL